MTLAFSRRLALGAGLFLPAIETWRRWGQFGQLSKWPVIFDDFLAGDFWCWARSLAAARCPSAMVVAFKAFLFGLSLAGLVGALRTPPSR